MKMEAYIRHIHNVVEKRFFNFFAGNIGKKKDYEDFVDRRIDISSLEKLIIDNTSEEVLDFISTHRDLKATHPSVLFSTYDKTYVENVDWDNIKTVINFKRLNFVRDLNEHFASVNKLLPDAGLYIGRVEVYGHRKLRIYEKYPRFTAQLLWLADFIIHRFIPKIKYLRNIYFYFVKKNRAISRPEILGRIVFSGFSLLEYKFIGDFMYFAAMKTGGISDNKTPTYYPLVRLNRVGKNGKIIKVFKMRTMHPYSEYLQDFLVAENGYDDKGKPKDDWRVTRWGAFARKLWLDEAPQILNVLKGEMKLVGVRPLSKYRFSELPEDMQKARVKYKPGCFPPYVALNMPDQEGNIEAERIYLRDKEKHPYTTDIRYLWKAVSNILLNKIRSA